MSRSFLGVAVLACVVAGPARADSKDIVDVAVAAGNFKTLAKLLGDADLVQQMKGPGPYTVFAPTDEAFAKVPAATLEALAKDKKKLHAVLTYHVLTYSATIDDLKQFKDVSTAEGHRAKLAVVNGALTVDGAKVVKGDIACSNGIIHVIDTVLMPK